MSVLVSDYATILNMFKSDDDIRQHFLKPFVINDFAIATDANCMVFFDKNLCPGIEPFTGKDANGIIGVIPTERNVDFNITVETLQEAINTSPLVDEFLLEEKRKKCDACDGDGEVEYKFSHGRKYHTLECECPECYGEGEIIGEVKTPTGKQVIDLDGFIKIRFSTFSIRNMLRIIEVAKILKQDVITLTYMVKEFSPSIFKIGNVEILVMPIITNDGKLAVCHIE